MTDETFEKAKELKEKMAKLKWDLFEYYNGNESSVIRQIGKGNVLLSEHFAALHMRSLDDFRKEFESL